MTDSASDVAVTRILNRINATTDPAEISALSAEFARQKPAAIPSPGDDYPSPAQQVIAKILSQEDKFQALHDLRTVAELGGASPEDDMGSRHSLSVPAAQAWNDLIQKLPDSAERSCEAIEAMSFAKTGVMKDVAASALLSCLINSRVLTALETFGYREACKHAVESGNAFLQMQVKEFSGARQKAFADLLASQPGIATPSCT